MAAWVAVASDYALEQKPLLRRLMKFGMAIATKMPMVAMTIMSSIRVKLLSFVLIYSA